MKLTNNGHIHDLWYCRITLVQVEMKAVICVEQLANTSFSSLHLADR